MDGWMDGWMLYIQRDLERSACSGGEEAWWNLQKEIHYFSVQVLQKIWPEKFVSWHNSKDFYEENPKKLPDFKFFFFFLTNLQISVKGSSR